MDEPLEMTHGGIPRSLEFCFQEYEFESLELERHRELVIERALAFGNRRELRWLYDRLGREVIRAWVVAQGARRLPWRRYNLWCVWLGLPPAERARPEGERVWRY